MTTEDWYDLYAVSPCNQELQPPLQPESRMMRCYFEPVVDNMELIDVFGEVTAEKLWRKWVRKRCPRRYEEYKDNSGTIYRLAGHRDRVHGFLARYIQSLRVDLLSVSGDDTYYDYFPSEVEFLGDFIRQTKDVRLIKDFNRLIDRILTHEDSPYKDDTEDTITDDYKI